MRDRWLRLAESLARGPARNLGRIIRGIVDELTDQAAYRRHLELHGIPHSAAAWRNFQDEHWNAKARRGRCC